MDEKPDQIIGQIEAHREELGRNLSELENRVRRSTDWRTYYDRNPMLIVGAALGGGVLLGTIVGSRRSNGGHRREKSHRASQFAGASAGVAAAQTARRPTGPATSTQKTKIYETVDHVKAALIGFGIAKAKEFLSHAIPGLDHHLEEAASKHQPDSGAYNYGGGHGGAEDFRSHTEAGSSRAASHEPIGVGMPSGMP